MAENGGERRRMAENGGKPRKRRRTAENGGEWRGQKTMDKNRGGAAFVTRITTKPLPRHGPAILRHSPPFSAVLHVFAVFRRSPPFSAILRHSSAIPPPFSAILSHNFLCKKMSTTSVKACPYSPGEGGGGGVGAPYLGKKNGREQAG